MVIDWGQRTAKFVALTVRGVGPSAKGLGMLDVFPRSGKREHEAEDQKKGNVEAGADHHAHVERAAAAAAFDVRWHAHLWYLCVSAGAKCSSSATTASGDALGARAAVTAATAVAAGDLFSA